MLYVQIAHNKRNTWIVMIGFCLLLIAIALFLTDAFGSGDIGLLFLAIGIGYELYVYYYATRHLMKVTNAIQLSRNDAPQIYEIVEELCLAAGIPVPKIYITPDEEPNAFATGRDPAHASLALTRGLIQLMNKEELRGVIGHELSHIRNYDIRVTTIASGLANLVSYTGLGMVIFGWSLLTTNERGWIALFFRIVGLAILMVGGVITIIGIPIAKLLFYATSRQREYLADAGSVDLTREPSGLISALAKLEKLAGGSASSEKLVQKDPMLNALAFNVPTAGNWLINLFADHPALGKRIQRLKNSAK